MRPKKILSVVFVTLLLCCAVSANEDCDIPNDVNTLIHDFVIQFPNDYKMVAWRPWANTSLENCSEENPLNMAIVTLKSTLNQLHKDSRALSKGRLLNDMLIACEASEILQESNSDGHGPILANRTDCLCRTEVNAARLGDILREVVHGKRDHKCPAAPTAITDAITTASSTVESTTADAISTPVVSDDDKNDTGRLEGSVDSSPNSDWWMIAALVFMTTTVVLLSLLVRLPTTTITTAGLQETAPPVGVPPTIDRKPLLVRRPPPVDVDAPLVVTNPPLAIERPLVAAARGARDPHGPAVRGGDGDGQPERHGHHRQPGVSGAARDPRDSRDSPGRAPW